ncbi:uridine diphosphate glucose pyrophosphatase NUDT14 isoform X12 [Canis lupus familiaris]|uniref:uridine diphosphate glucose pyrophosphatase NUDT14 isoform X12 n=1 Tax=Canis lupus familiaris TaxID=9615 RepID=UPI0018F7D634|nr:uridine diphosphate glucose pyrophosphatase NUDT14 isoform X12 [Canis lupus familiaris]
MERIEGAAVGRCAASPYLRPLTLHYRQGPPTCPTRRQRPAAPVWLLPCPQPVACSECPASSTSGQGTCAPAEPELIFPAPLGPACGRLPVKSLSLECPSLTFVGPGAVSPPPGSPPSSAALAALAVPLVLSSMSVSRPGRAQGWGCALQGPRADPVAEGRRAEHTLVWVGSHRAGPRGPRSSRVGRDPLGTRQDQVEWLPFPLAPRRGARLAQRCPAGRILGPQTPCLSAPRERRSSCPLDRTAALTHRWLPGALGAPRGVARRLGEQDDEASGRTAGRQDARETARDRSRAGGGSALCSHHQRITCPLPSCPWRWCPLRRLACPPALLPSCRLCAVARGTFCTEHLISLRHRPSPPPCPTVLPALGDSVHLCSSQGAGGSSCCAWDASHPWSGFLPRP